MGLPSVFLCVLFTHPAFAMPKWRPEFEGKWNLTYKIGDEWGKLIVTAEQLTKESGAFKRAAMATAKVTGGTAFFLGRFNAHQVAVTNYHVMKKASDCEGRFVIFRSLGLKLTCEKFLGAWPEIDLALFTLKSESNEQDLILEDVARNFAFKEDIYPGQRLLTMGYGIAGNRWGDLVAVQDADCRVFSAKNDFRLMADPDEINPEAYKAWSFSNGCDVSHGDSGSAMIDRDTGQVVGIIWTGKFPKNPKVQSSKYLETLLKEGGREIWTELSYAVPARAIYYQLQKAIEKMSDGNTRDTLRDIIR